MIRNCNGCVYISISEFEQNIIYGRTGRRIDHRCRISGEILKHKGEHPKILMECDCFTER